MALKGSRELRRRLKAIKTVFKPVGRAWADETALRARRYAPRKTGKGAASIKRKNASQKKASVKAIYYMDIQTEGSVAHEIKPRRMRAVKFTPKGGGQPVFAKRVQHPGHGKNDYAERAAKEALFINPMADELAKLWDEAA